MKLRILRGTIGATLGKVVEGTFIGRSPAPDGHEWIEIDEGATITVYLGDKDETVKVNSFYRSDVVQEVP